MAKSIFTWRTRTGTVAVFVATAGILLSGCSGTPDEKAINVLAASSTRVVNDDFQKAARESGLAEELGIVNAGSSTLVQQLSDGAPGDLLLTANEKTMDDAVERGTVNEPRVLAHNTMVMVVPKGNPAGLRSIRDLSDDDVFVVCDPQVPCGDISRSLMKANELTVTPDSQEHQVADVLSRVATGEADAGWVYSTDAVSAGDKVATIDIAHAEEFRNNIVGATTKDARHPEAAGGLLDLLDREFDEQWADHGFEPAHADRKVAGGV